MLYDDCMAKLRAKAKDKYIWVSLDETQDVEKRHVANFIFGILDNEQEVGKCYVLNVVELSVVNASAIAKFFTDSLLLLWPNGNFFF